MSKCFLGKFCSDSRIAYIVTKLQEMMRRHVFSITSKSTGFMFHVIEAGNFTPQLAGNAPPLSSPSGMRCASAMGTRIAGGDQSHRKGSFKIKVIRTRPGQVYFQSFMSRDG